MLKKKSNKFTAILLSVILSGLIPAAVTFADNLVVDGDGLEPVSGNMLNFGDVVPGSKTTKRVYFALKRSGQGKLNNVFANASPIIINHTDDPNDLLSVVMKDDSITTPTNWTQLDNIIWTGDTAWSEVTLSIPTGADTDVDPTTVTLSFSAVGAEAVGGLLTRTENLQATYKVVAPTTPPDTTKPTLSYTLNPSDPNGENGWYTSSVAVEFIYSDEDGGSGINELTAPRGYTLEADGVHNPNTVSVSDNKGNIQTVTVPEIKIDKTAPTLTHILNPENPDGNSGWYTSPVAVDFTANDPAGGSGLNNGLIPADYMISIDGTTNVLTYSVKDLAGNIGSTTVPVIKLDQTKPVISGQATTSPNANRWYNDDVTIRYDFSDAISGIVDEESTFEETLSTEAENQSSSYTVYDVAGNSETATVSGINIDKTKPVITINLPVEVPSYKLKEVVLADWSVHDSLSGIDPTSVSATVANGQAIDTSLIGQKSFTVTATDLAGNTETKTVNYNVIYDFDGFFQPISMEGLNSAKAGSSIPIKFSLNGDMGLNILNGAPKAYTYFDSGRDELSIVDTITAGKSGLSYDPVSDQYTYVWKTEKSWAGTTKLLEVILMDGTKHYAKFTFK